MLVSRSFAVFVLLLVIVAGASAQTIGSSGHTDRQGDVSQLGGVVTVTAPNTFATSGQIIAVNIAASDTTGQNITGFEAQIQYDSSVMVPSGPNAGCSTTGTLFAATGGNVTCSNNFPSPNVISVFMFGVLPVTGSGTILRLNFQVVGAAGTASPINFNNFFFNEGDPADVTVNGSVSVVSPTAANTFISGRVVSKTGIPISKARVILIDSNGEERVTLSNPFGFYRFHEVAVGQVYVLTATSKSYTFEPRTIAVQDEVHDFDLIGLD